MDLIIRPCRRDDLRALEWDGLYRDDRPLIEAVYHRTRMRDMTMLVAVVGAELVGQMWIDFGRKRSVAVLWALRVAPAWRGRGIGTILITAAERAAREGGARFAELGVEDNNPRARALYESLGYRLVGREPAHDAITGVPLGFEIDLLRRPIAVRHEM